MTIEQVLTTQCLLALVVSEMKSPQSIQVMLATCCSQVQRHNIWHVLRLRTALSIPLLPVILILMHHQWNRSEVSTISMLCTGDLITMVDEAQSFQTCMDIRGDHPTNSPAFPLDWAAAPFFRYGVVLHAHHWCERRGACRTGRTFQRSPKCASNWVGPACC